MPWLETICPTSLLKGTVTWDLVAFMKIPHFLHYTNYFSIFFLLCCFSFWFFLNFNFFNIFKINFERILLYLSKSRDIFLKITVLFF